MIRPLGALLLLVCGTGALKTPANEDFYMASVVEYHSVMGGNESASLNLNVERYIKLIAEAAKYADIVVFPEAALLHASPSVFIEVPAANSSVAPADNPQAHPALKALSAAARNNSIYVTVNLHEVMTSGNTTVRYNTNVVFNRNGTVVGRYRKYNLFSEAKVLNITKNPEHVFFDTDFGVRFGIFTCFDILFKEPTLVLKKFNATDYIFPTWWFSELPFLTAVQEQAAWAYANDANLLASGGNDVHFGTTGSGIYAGRKGPVVYTQSSSQEVLLLTARIYKKNKTGVSTGAIRTPPGMPPPENSRLKMKADILSYYNTVSLSPRYNAIKSLNSTNIAQNYLYEATISQGKFSCAYSINMTFVYKSKQSVNVTEITQRDDGFHHHHYSVGIFDGVRTFDGFATGGMQVCGIMPCLNESASSCGLPTLGALPTSISINGLGELYLYSTRFESIIIKTSTLDNGAFAEPSVLESSSKPGQFGALPLVTDYSFSHTGTTAELRLKSDRLGTAAILARVFSRDGGVPGVAPSSSPSLQSGKFIIIFTTLLFLFLKNHV